MKLTLKNRLKLCWEILTIYPGCYRFGNCPNEKALAVFQRGYVAGMKDARHEATTPNTPQDAKCCDWKAAQLLTPEVRKALSFAADILVECRYESEAGIIRSLLNPNQTGDDL